MLLLYSSRLPPIESTRSCARSASAASTAAAAAAASSSSAAAACVKSCTSPLRAPARLLRERERAPPGEEEAEPPGDESPASSLLLRRLFLSDFSEFTSPFLFAEGDLFCCACIDITKSSIAPTVASGSITTSFLPLISTNPVSSGASSSCSLMGCVRYLMPLTVELSLFSNSTKLSSFARAVCRWVSSSENTTCSPGSSMISRKAFALLSISAGVPVVR
mmetsp:Transcript_18136/g.70103  ORF Transcript_18136/g.70103 Transcript_18136/m.70103 type:complete len:220 (-) Transcript_18136:2221-2880(-)